MGHPAGTIALVTDQVSRIRLAGSIIRHQATALEKLATHVPADFSDAVDLLLNCNGSAIVTGMGKAGWIGQKISASLASTGTRSHFVHPGEAIHGDLGRIADNDVVIALSNSGETEELNRVIPSLQRRKIPVIAVTATVDNTLARNSTLVLEYGKSAEAGHLGLAPSTSTTLMLALGDALTLVVSQARQFRPTDFARFHPGGSLGRKLASVDEVMRPISQCRIASESETVRGIYVRSSTAERRVGVILVVDATGKLAGLFTDSDLARLLERRKDQALDLAISGVMTRSPTTVRSGSPVALAVEILASKSLSELPVTDDKGRAIGIVDITDLIGLVPVNGQ